MIPKHFSTDRHYAATSKEIHEFVEEWYEHRPLGWETLEKRDVKYFQPEGINFLDKVKMVDPVLNDSGQIVMLGLFPSKKGYRLASNPSPAIFLAVFPENGPGFGGLLTMTPKGFSIDGFIMERVSKEGFGVKAELSSEETNRFLSLVDLPRAFMSSRFQLAAKAEAKHFAERKKITAANRAAQAEHDLLVEGMLSGFAKKPTP